MIIGVIADCPDLERVLRGVVDLLVDATDCHACFVYLREGDQLHIRAASPVFAHVVGTVGFGIDEGLTGWAAYRFLVGHRLARPRCRGQPCARGPSEL